MVETTPKLSEAESERYDRQIRLWGMESQLRLHSAVFAVVGMDGLGAEIVKNLVLAGVGGVVMFDQNNATEIDLKSQFLIPRTSLGQNRAEASLQRASALNPLVKVHAEKRPVLTAINNFEGIPKCRFIISCNQDVNLNLQLSKVARDTGAGFFAVWVLGTFGAIFCDLQNHKYSMEVTKYLKKKPIKTIVERELCYSSFEESLTFDANDPLFLKRFRFLPASYFVYKIILKFHEETGKYPTSSEDDFQKMLKMRDLILEQYPLPPKKLPDELFRCVTSDLPNPSCAIIGGFAAQDAVKAALEKDEPLRNFFFFDPLTLSGHNIYIGPASQLA